jgi:hypothetical protein
MNRYPTIPTISILVGLLAACASQVSEVRRYSGTALAKNVALSKGNVTITNRNGSVWVDTAGRAGSLDVIARPFASGPDDAAAEQAAVATMSQLSLATMPDPSGGVVVSGSGDDASGFDLIVHLPYPFGGLLTITVTNGYVHYVGSSGANGATLKVTTGDIFVQDGGKNLQIKGGRSNINLIALPTITGTSIATDDGNITAQIPDSANLLITATTASGGTITPPPNRDVQGDQSNDNSTSSFDLGPHLRTLAVSTVAGDHKSATIQLGDPLKIQQLHQYMTVSTGNGNVVFR